MDANISVSLLGIFFVSMFTNLALIKKETGILIIVNTIQWTVHVHFSTFLVNFIAVFLCFLLLLNDHFQYIFLESYWKDFLG